MTAYSHRRKRLEELTNVLLRESSPLSELRGAATGLHDLFDSISPILPHVQSVSLSSGIALGSRDAAACTRDPLRTATFLRGLNAAIEESRRRFRNRRIEIVYAGTGPYATLAVPIMPRLDPRDVRFTLIDTHAESIASVARVLRYFGLTRFARALIACDATAYEHPRQIQLHVAIVETMQRSLSVEPQVAICRQIARQMHRRGIMVPQRVTVDFEFTESPEFALSDGTYRTRVGQAFQLSLANARQFSQRSRKLRINAVHVPPNAIGMYTTHIQAYGRHTLAPGESGLTQPEIVWPLINFERGERIEFTYEVGTNPGIRFERKTRKKIAGLT